MKFETIIFGVFLDITLYTLLSHLVILSPNLPLGEQHNYCMTPTNLKNTKRQENELKLGSKGNMSYNRAIIWYTDLRDNDILAIKSLFF